jgi:RimJ/RimL family protein N-acetyltransferase
MELTTPRLILREFRESDFDALWDYQSNPETHRYEKGVPSQEAVRQFLWDAEFNTKEQPRTHFRFAVTVRPEDRVVGHIKFTSHWEEINEWEIGWDIHPNLWGEGYATEAARDVLKFAFGELHVHRVVAFCNAHNAASVRVMQKIGMVQDGLLRGTRWWNGDWCDEYVYGILDRDWARHSGEI